MKENRRECEVAVVSIARGHAPLDLGPGVAESVLLSAGVVAEPGRRIEVELKAPLNDDADSLVVSVDGWVDRGEVGLGDRELEALAEARIAMRGRSHPCGLQTLHLHVVRPELSVGSFLRGRGAHTGGEGQGQSQGRDEGELIHDLNLFIPVRGQSSK